MRLIDADALLEGGLHYRCAQVDGGGLILVPMADVRQSIKNAPTVVSVPVIHGRWFDTGVENGTGNIYFCSVCGKYNNPNKKDVEMKRTKEKPDYCPHCGARMDGDNDE